MNKNSFKIGVMSAVIFTMSAGVAMAYYEYGPATAPGCGNAKPQKAWLYRVKSLGKGQYQLYWDKAERASSWTVGYGTQPGKYIYGQNDFGDSQSRNMVVNTFSNKKFYFAIKANNGCMPGDWSNEWTVGTSSFVGTTSYVAPTRIIPTPTTTKPVVTTTPVKGGQPVVTKAPGVKTPTPTTLPKTGGFWGWLKGLFQ